MTVEARQAEPLQRLGTIWLWRPLWCGRLAYSGRFGLAVPSHRCLDRCGLGTSGAGRSPAKRGQNPGHDVGASALPRLLARILLVHHERPAATPHHDRACALLQPRSEFLTFMI